MEKEFFENALKQKRYQNTLIKQSNEDSKKVNSPQTQNNAESKNIIQGDQDDAINHVDN